jgi:hypothetical protein
MSDFMSAHFLAIAVEAVIGEGKASGRVVGARRQ